MRNFLKFASLVILALCFSGAAHAQKTVGSKSDGKKIVAVLSFDDASLGNKDLSLSRHFIDSLTKELTKTKKYGVAEKQQIEAVMKELNLSFDEAMDPKTVAKVGKRVSANTAIFGTITEYNTVDREISVLGRKGTRYTATVGVIIRLVDINTGIVVESVESTETANEDIVDLGFVKTKTADSRDFRINLFTKAANKAVKTAVAKLSPLIQSDTTQLVAQNKTSEKPKTATPAKTAPTEPTRSVSNPTTSSPKISRVTKTTIYLSGFNSAKVGDLVSVMRGAGAGKEIALLKVKVVNANFVEAEIVEGGGVLDSDRVKIIQ